MSLGNAIDQLRADYLLVNQFLAAEQTRLAHHLKSSPRTLQAADDALAAHLRIGQMIGVRIKEQPADQLPLFPELTESPAHGDY